MPDCKKLDPLVTPYVDGELESANRAEVDAHLRVCPPCHARVVVEQSVRDLLSARKHAFKETCAPARLRSRCAEVARLKPRTTKNNDDGVARGFSRATLSPAAWRTHIKPLALAASLVLVVSAAFLYALTDRSNRVMAAELVADHRSEERRVGKECRFRRGAGRWRKRKVLASDGSHVHGRCK